MDRDEFERQLGELFRKYFSEKVATEHFECRGCAEVGVGAVVTEVRVAYRPFGSKVHVCGED